MQQVMAWDWSSRSSNMYYNTFTWVEPAPIDGGDRGPAAESEHLLSLRLPSKWLCHPQTTVPLTLFYQRGHLCK